MCNEYHQTATPEIVSGHRPPDKRKFEHSNKVANRAVDQSHEYHPTTSPEIVSGHRPPDKREFEFTLA